MLGGTTSGPAGPLAGLRLVDLRLVLLLAALHL